MSYVRWCMRQWAVHGGWASLRGVASIDGISPADPPSPQSTSALDGPAVPRPCARSHQRCLAEDPVSRYTFLPLGPTPMPCQATSSGQLNKCMHMLCLTQRHSIKESRSNQWQVNSLNDQLTKREVILPTSQVTHLSSDLLMTTCSTFLTTSARVWCTWYGNPQESVSIIGMYKLTCQQVDFFSFSKLAC